MPLSFLRADKKAHRRFGRDGEKMNTKNKGNFTSGRVFLPLLLFMLPILGANLLQSMYGAVDLLVIGQFETKAEISAVSTGSLITFTIQLIIGGLATGATVLIGRYLGEGKNEEIGKIVGAAIAVFSVVAVILTVGVYLLSPAIVSLMKVPEEAASGANTYIKICALGMVFTVAYNLISAVFRGLGNSVTPLLFVLIACVANVVGDLVLVGVFGMGVSGVAIATVGAQAISVGLFLFLFRFMKMPFDFKLRDIKFQKPQAAGILRIGTPLALADFLAQISFLAIAAIVNGMGLVMSSGYGVGTKLIGFIMLVPSAFAQAISAFTAQNMGAGEHARARQAMQYGIGGGLCVGVLIFTAANLFGEEMSALFSTDADVISASALYLRGFSLDCILTCILFGMLGYFNGYGRTVFVMAQSVAFAFLVRAPLAFLASLMPGVTLWHIGFVTPLCTIFEITVCILYYRFFRRSLVRLEY